MKYDATYEIAMRRDGEMAESQSGLSQIRQGYWYHSLRVGGQSLEAIPVYWKLLFVLIMLL
jgi:hypothetical protein